MVVHPPIAGHSLDVAVALVSCSIRRNWRTSKQMKHQTHSAMTMVIFEEFAMPQYETCLRSNFMLVTLRFAAPAKGQANLSTVDCGLLRNVASLSGILSVVRHVVTLCRA